MKIVHISDLHYPHHSGTERLVTKIIGHYQDEAIKPIVVCSGDVLDTPSENNNFTHYRAVKEILAKLKTQGFKILLCPGNHDLKKGGLGNKKQIYSKLVDFSTHFSPLLPPDANNDNNINLIDFPIIHKIENHFFIGLNSMTSQPKKAKGALGKEQLNKLEAELFNIREKYLNPIIIVYLHHNPFPFSINIGGLPKIGDQIATKKLKLTDSSSFLEIVKGINILLFGHLHYNKRYTDYESKYDINCIHLTGGSTVGAKVSWKELDTSTYQSKEINL